MSDADVIVVGSGLAGLVATAELVDAHRRVILVDQEPEASLGGQAFWAFGGRSSGSRASATRASWPGRTGSAAGFDRPRTTGPAAGRRRTSTSPRARNGPGYAPAAWRSCPIPAGPGEAATSRRGTHRVDELNSPTARTGEPLIDPAQMEREVVARDREMALGGLETDLEGRVLRPGASRCRACAASEVAGLGRGGMRGHRALEGTFLGGCIFSGRAAGRAAAAAVA